MFLKRVPTNGPTKYSSVFKKKKKRGLVKKLAYIYNKRKAIKDLLSLFKATLLYKWEEKMKEGEGEKKEKEEEELLWY